MSRKLYVVIGQIPTITCIALATYDYRISVVAALAFLFNVFTMLLFIYSTAYEVQP